MDDMRKMEIIATNAAKKWLEGPIEWRYQVTMRSDEMKALYDAGYRLDPYPNGKSKAELLDIINAKQAEVDKLRLAVMSLREAIVDDCFEIRTDLGKLLYETGQLLAETTNVPEVKP